MGRATATSTAALFNTVMYDDARRKLVKRSESWPCLPLQECFRGQSLLLPQKVPDRLNGAVRANQEEQHIASTVEVNPDSFLCRRYLAIIEP